jgi:hypothetical protein
MTCDITKGTDHLSLYTRNPRDPTQQQTMSRGSLLTHHQPCQARTVDRRAGANENSRPLPHFVDSLLRTSFFLIFWIRSNQNSSRPLPHNARMHRQTNDETQRVKFFGTGTEKRCMMNHIVPVAHRIIHAIERRVCNSVCSSL